MIFSNTNKSRKTINNIQHVIKNTDFNWSIKTLQIIVKKGDYSRVNVPMTQLSHHGLPLQETTDATSLMYYYMLNFVISLSSFILEHLCLAIKRS